MTIRQQILQTLRANPHGLTNSELCALMNRSGVQQKHTTMSTHLNALRLSGRVRAEPIPGSLAKRYYATDVAPAAPPVERAALPAPQSSAATAEDKLPERGSLSGSLASLAHALAGSIAEAFGAELRRALQSKLDEVVTALPAQLALPAPVADTVDAEPAPRAVEPAAPHTAAKLTVTIFGLLDAQAAMIDSEFGRDLNLRYVRSSDAASQRARGLIRTSDYVVTMAGFISHSTEDLIRSMGAKLVRVSGGMTSLRNELTRLYVES
ncbi:hypothetical protein [Schlegelella aquatica]|uniref:hypothetical protein n=1 Tax=Caldimonas aquatica TaxID=376175 RepID=UPI003752EEB2